MGPAFYRGRDCPALVPVDLHAAHCAQNAVLQNLFGIRRTTAAERPAIDVFVLSIGRFTCEASPGAQNPIAPRAHLALVGELFAIDVCESHAHDFFAPRPFT